MPRWIWGVVGFTAVIVVIGLAVSGNRDVSPARSQPTATLSESSRRILFQDLPSDDGNRAAVFQGLLAKSGARCDQVVSALSSAPGQWRIRCVPGYVYVLTFDQYGKVVFFEHEK